MKSSTLQQEIYQYKDSQLSHNRNFYTSRIEEESNTFDEKKQEFSKELDCKLNIQINAYKKLEENSCKKIIHEKKLLKIHEEKEKLLVKLLSEFESELEKIIVNVAEKSVSILNCEKKDLDVKVPTHIKSKINSKKISFNVYEDSSLLKYEFICKFKHNLVRFNLKDEIFSIIQREVNTK